MIGRSRPFDQCNGAFLRLIQEALQPEDARLHRPSKDLLIVKEPHGVSLIARRHIQVNDASDVATCLRLMSEIVQRSALDTLGHEHIRQIGFLICKPQELLGDRQ